MSGLLVHFVLSDVDPEFRSKKEVIKIGDSDFKPFSRHLLSKKRKIDELYDFETPASNLLMAVDILLEKYSDRGAMIEDLANTQEKLLQKVNKTKRKVEFLKTVLAKKSSHVNEEELARRDTFLEEVKRDATIAVLESKIHMATEAIENGLDSNLWDVEAWKEKLARMKDNYVVNPFFVNPGGFKVPKRSAAKAPKVKIFGGSSRGEVSNLKCDENMVIADDPVSSEGSSGEEGI